MRPLRKNSPEKGHIRQVLLRFLVASLLTLGISCTDTGVESQGLSSWFIPYQGNWQAIRGMDDVAPGSWAPYPQADAVAGVVRYQDTSYLLTRRSGLFRLNLGDRGIQFSPVLSLGSELGEHRQAQFPFVHQDRIFFVVSAEPTWMGSPMSEDPSMELLSLYYYRRGEERAIPYPLVTQVNDPTWQPVGLNPANEFWAIQWKRRVSTGVEFRRTQLDPRSGVETEASQVAGTNLFPVQDSSTLPSLLFHMYSLWPSLWGTPVPGVHLSDSQGLSRGAYRGTGGGSPQDWFRAYSGPEYQILLAPSGRFLWSHSQSTTAAPDVRLHELPDLGPRGFYNGVWAVEGGFLFSWTSYQNAWVGPWGLYYLSHRELGN